MAGPFTTSSSGAARDSGFALTVDAYPARTSHKVLTLTGTKNVRVIDIYTADMTGSLTITSNTTWEAEVKLIPGSNKFRIYGVDAANNTTGSLNISITLKPLETEVHQVFNNVSEHGIPRALPQILGEKSYFYRNRLMDVFRYPTNTTMNGLHFGINRELSLKYYQGFRLRVKTFDDGTFGATICRAWIDNCVMMVQCEQFFISDELVYVEPGTDKFNLNYYPRYNTSFRVRTMDGDLLPARKYEVDWKEREVKVLDENYRGQWLRVSYNYTYVTYLYDKTLQELADELVAIEIDDRQLFECSVRAPSWDAWGLFQQPEAFIIDEDWSSFWWSRIRARELHNYWYREFLLNDYGAAYGTKIEGWSEEVNSKTGILWKDTRLDKHYWNIIPESIQTFGTLPHLWDSFRGHWNCEDPLHNPRYNLKQYLRYGGVCPEDGTDLVYVGVRKDQFQSGTGTGSDLLVSLTAYRDA